MLSQPEASRMGLLIDRLDERFVCVCTCVVCICLAQRSCEPKLVGVFELHSARKKARTHRWCYPNSRVRRVCVCVGGGHWAQLVKIESGNYNIRRHGTAERARRPRRDGHTNALCLYLQLCVWECVVNMVHLWRLSLWCVLRVATPSSSSMAEWWIRHIRMRWNGIVNRWVCRISDKLKWNINLTHNSNYTIFVMVLFKKYLVYTLCNIS